MRAEIITIGDEVLAGNVVDTNTTFLADQLWLNGIIVSYHAAVRDDESDIIRALDMATSRSDLVLVTGGLGPTADDITISSATKLFRKKLELNHDVLKHLEALFKKVGREPSENNNRQAYIPSGARVFLNRLGTAPGIVYAFRKKAIYFMPGVPKEMKALFTEQMLPEILAKLKRPEIFVHELLKCFGSPESTLDLALKDLYTSKLEIDGVRVGFRVSFPETFIKLSAWGQTKQEALEALDVAKAKVMERVSGAYYGHNEDTLESVVGRLLNEKKKTLSVAESCTGGLIAHRLTNISGSSDYFLNGVVSYSNEAKIKVLGVHASTLQKEGAVSAACVKEMAQGIRRLSKTDYGIAVSGIAGPTGGTPKKPVGTVYIALATPNGVESKEYHFPRDRETFKLIVSSTAINWLRKELWSINF
ncbi:MAG: hypothetical protein ACD_73C00768G0004 [uncultured bacterium]|nr:MAG: hypothetical protein ACD_73C00768G0004 [uncultured bacterium]